MKTIYFFIKAWLLVAVLDIIAAMLSFYLSTGKSPAIVLKFIASAVVGSDAYTGGLTSMLLGMVLHFLVAFLFTLFFFLVYKPLALYRYNVYLVGILYGMFIWLVMNKLVLPITSVMQQPFKWVEAGRAMLILITMIGLPLAFMLKKRQKI
ncbi:MAG: hypothetical protein ACOYVG_00810 [Bacteroidota bacterium]